MDGKRRFGALLTLVCTRTEQKGSKTKSEIFRTTSPELSVRVLGKPCTVRKST